MQILESNNVLKEKYNNTVGAGVLMGTTWGVIILFVLITIVYHYNTIKNQDEIKAEITHTVINLLKYAISTFI
jgi:preprotein translocase subunit SecG